ncbi:hypothetical protein BKA93DRAFT_398299 [Sparassis latifolia]
MSGRGTYAIRFTSINNSSTLPLAARRWLHLGILDVCLSVPHFCAISAQPSNTLARLALTRLCLGLCQVLRICFCCHWTCNKPRRKAGGRSSLMLRGRSFDPERLNSARPALCVHIVSRKRAHCPGLWALDHLSLPSIIRPSLFLPFFVITGVEFTTTIGTSKSTSLRCS